jgi:hypothetical protein
MEIFSYGSNAVFHFVMQASTFRTSAVRVRRKMWWQNTKMCIILIVVILIILTIIVLVILGQTGHLK